MRHLQHSLEIIRRFSPSHHHPVAIFILLGRCCCCCLLLCGVTMNNLSLKESQLDDFNSLQSKTLHDDTTHNSDVLFWMRLFFPMLIFFIIQQIGAVIVMIYCYRWEWTIINFPALTSPLFSVLCVVFPSHTSFSSSAFDARGFSLSLIHTLTTPLRRFLCTLQMQK